MKVISTWACLDLTGAPLVAVARAITRAENTKDFILARLGCRDDNIARGIGENMLRSSATNDPKG